jgi:NADH-quinone oxidoreductase subunit C
VSDTPGADRPGDTEEPPDGLAVPDPGQESVVGVRHGMFGVSGSGDTSGFSGLVETVVAPGPSFRPYGGDFDVVVDHLEQALQAAGEDFDQAIEHVVVDRGELTLRVRAASLLAVVRVLRDSPDLRYELLSGVSGAHFPSDVGRELHAVHHLLSLTHTRRLRLEVTCSDADPHVPSVVEVYPTANWHERETWDFFGIQFDGHPSLTRIEMPDDWPGHPQRKDYPLGGIPVEYKGAKIPPPDTRRSYR